MTKKKKETKNIEKVIKERKLNRIKEENSY